MRGGQEKEVAARLRAVVAGQGKPVLSTFLGFDGVPAELAVPGDVAPMPGSIPSYSSPERAISALAHVARYARWRRRDTGHVPDLSPDVEAARALVTGVMRQHPAGRHLEPGETAELLGHFGIRVVERRPVSDERAAVRAASELGWPVALTASGGVRLHLREPDDVAVAWRSLGLAERDEAAVQPMVTRGTSTLLQVHDDRSFGSLVSFGVGGVATDLLDDRAYAVVPLTDLDADEFIRSPRAFPLLTGYGGAQPADVPALVDLALRLSQLADRIPEVVQCSLDPIVAAPDGAHVLEARVRLAPPLAHHDLGARRLPGL
jgi:acyl-CoA synthetase (NDP forming)